MNTPSNNADILRAMLAEGRTVEAVKWLEMLAARTPASELAQLQQLVLHSSTKRKRGGAGHIRDGFVEAAREWAFARAVQSLREQDATLSLEDAAARVAEDGVPDPDKPGRRLRKSESAVRGYYYKWRVASS